MRIPSEIQAQARGWTGDRLFSAAARRSWDGPVGKSIDVTVGGRQQIRHGALAAVVSGVEALDGAWRRTPLAVIDLGRGFWLVSQTHRDGRLFTPSDLRPGLWQFEMDGPPKLAAVVDHVRGGTSVMTIGRYSRSVAWR